jgi:hypothetical protein
LVMRAWFWMALQALLETVQVVSLTIFIWEWRSQDTRARHCSQGGISLNITACNDVD